MAGSGLLVGALWVEGCAARGRPQMSSTRSMQGGQKLQGFSGFRYTSHGQKGRDFLLRP